MGYAKRHDEFQTLIDRLNTGEKRLKLTVLFWLFQTLIDRLNTAAVIFEESGALVFQTLIDRLHTLRQGLHYIHWIFISNPYR